MASPMAPSSEIGTIAPAIAEPIGNPAKLSAIETANARPIHSGSVRRCRTVNSVTSNGPVATPRTTIAAATSHG